MGKRRKAEQQPLSEYWKPPADSGIKDGVGAPVACLTTTFEFDAGFFEAELLPRFLGLRFDHTENERTFVIEREEALATTRVGVLVDMSKFDPRQTTLRWDQIPIQVPSGIQHAKLTLLVWERLVRLIVGSANLTRQGYRRNREVFAVLDFYDGDESVPAKPLRDALDFLDTICAWSRGLPAATQRVHDTVRLVRARVQRWSTMPSDFRPRERPRVTLVVGHPRHTSAPPKSVMEHLSNLWGPRRALRIIVATPFVGRAADGHDSVLSRLHDFQIGRDAKGWLVVPQTPAPEGKTKPIVPLPTSFGQGWRDTFGEGAYVLPIPAYVEKVDEKPRDLHAKAVFIQGNDHALLMIGSSNFTPHGMGVGVFNCEANLAFEDWAKAKQEGVALEDRIGIPVPWDSAIDVDEVVWQEPDQPPEDAPPSKHVLPTFFSWASYSQRTGEIRIGLDRAQVEPPVWSITLAGQSSEHAVMLFSRTTSPADSATLSYILDDKARGVHITALRVNWQAGDGSQNDGFLAVAVEDGNTDLLPPEEFRSLTVDSIIECLLSGREPAEWIEREVMRHCKTHSTDAAIESLRAVDTSNYLLYRVRRFGRALAAMSDRIARTAPTPDAIRYRLFRDPLGPIPLAEALCRRRNDSEGGQPAPAEVKYRLYALAEMILSLGYLGRHVRKASGRDGKWVMPIFIEACERLKAFTVQVWSETGALADGLGRYLDAVLAESGRLLRVPEEE